MTDTPNEFSETEKMLGREMTDEEKTEAAKMAAKMGEAIRNVDLIDMARTFGLQACEFAQEMAPGDVPPERVHQIAKSAVWGLMLVTQKISYDMRAALAEEGGIGEGAPLIIVPDQAEPGSEPS